ncbi:MAG TPA: 4'-phosphopantetheinyl transferase superfamily protein [Parapedobacter sp.]|nr:4'-phosphopantetheinyl transferase superfamily protein [Parapedobacter sp.]
MNKTTIISTWITEPQWADGWPMVHHPDQVPRPSVWLIDSAHTHIVFGGRCDRVLSEAELARAARFHQAAHRIRYKATHTVLRMLLAAGTHADAADLHFHSGHHNKPNLSDNQDLSTTFNLSYTENKSMIGVAEGRAIGVDIEWLNRPIAIADMLTACFSANEIDYITAQEDDMRRRFFTLWTRKEAILKLTGEGIGEHLPFFEVLDGSRITQKEIIGGNPPNTIYLYSFHIDEGYVGCYASSEAQERLPLYRLRELQT